MTNVRQTQLKLSTIMLALVMVAVSAAGVRAATASWDPNTEPDLAGYRLSYGTQPGVHTVVLDVGKVTTYQFNPAPGLRYYVVVQAYNTAGESSEKSAEVIVDIPLANLPPIFAQPVNQTTTANEAVSLALSASDPEGKPLTFTGTGLPPGLSIISASAKITGTPGTTGSYQVTITVSDGVLSVSRSFSWTVVPPNRPPTLKHPGDQTTAVNENVSLQISASDPEGKPLTFTATGLPSGLSINTVSGVISGKPRPHGTYQVTVTVSDGTLSTSASFSWKIQNPAGKSSISAEVEAANNDTNASAAPVDDDTDSPPTEEFAAVPGDFDGDGRVDLATYGKSSGTWRIWTSGSNFLSPVVMNWGTAADIPLPADYNGDLVTDLAVYRPSTGTWHLWLSGTQTPIAIHWGRRGEKPVAVDHDGDGKADLALLGKTGYNILLSSANYLKSVQVR